MATYGDYADIGYRGTITWNSDTYKFVDTAEVGNFATDSVETTHSGGTDYYMTFMAGMHDPGEVTFTILFDPDNPIEADRTTRELTVTFPPKSGQTIGATFQCDAFITGAPISEPVKDKMTQAVTFKLTGAPTFTAGS